MRKVSFFFLGICTFLFLASATISADNIYYADTPVFINEFNGQVDFIQGRILQLEEAFPQDKFEWSPAEGVRSVAGVYLHIAQANMMLAATMKGEKPEGGMDEKITDKANIAEELKKSFEAVKDAAKDLTEENLDKVFQTPFGIEMSLRNFMISLLNHMHEHHGQAIAYARMNNITPPWSKQG